MLNLLKQKKKLKDSLSLSHLKLHLLEKDCIIKNDMKKSIFYIICIIVIL